jgi:bifunctional non-homologous end joining protein LigD
MALEEYRRKRDFKNSPEPQGEVVPEKKKSKSKLFFCVQKHLASHLHYDFRLEHGGVLLSWAVPKGPSVNPKDKRLAMRVEDHPWDYRDFEGVIPEGYGAGIVMLWDRGTWTPETDDVDRALAKGDLKFTLDGYKLKGSWVLVRTRGYSRRSERDRAAGPDRAADSGRSWLLIKHRDEWSGDLDIAEFAPLSVKSGQDFHEILADDDPNVWRTNRPVEGGATGAMLLDVIQKAARLKLERAKTTQPARADRSRKAPAKQPRPKARAKS